ncbi:MAG: hypothetical protein ACOCTI_01180 [Phycisphaeraceae bacterium]
MLTYILPALLVLTASPAMAQEVSSAPGGHTGWLSVVVAVLLTAVVLAVSFMAPRRERRE